LVSNSSTSQVC